MRNSTISRMVSLACFNLSVFLAWMSAGGVTASELLLHLRATDVDSQRFQVELRCEGLCGEVIEFRMPAWTPGYYRLMHYARGVDGFEAEDGAGRPLPWQKAGDDAWCVTTGESESVVVRYRVRADRQFVAESFLDAQRAYVCPAATFMYVAGQIDHPITVSVEPHSAWSDLVTGLDSTDTQHAFVAPDFDTLYDCPILMGNLGSVEFTVFDRPHEFVGCELGAFDRSEFIHDMTRMIKSATAIVGNVPYQRYTFMAIGPGQGGIEHANSCAISFAGQSDGRSPTRNLRFMAFLAHEYFHLYNAKRIRPVELGPFDYERENRTHMLWMAEGFTLYYEHLILKRAGLTTREHLFERLAGTIARHESRPGRLVQSASDASWRTWDEGPFGGDPQTTISSYDKGAILGLLLDLAIRHESAGEKSLDDVMRLLYREYFQQRGRGYTEQEFRDACHEVAGAPLTEVLNYTTSTEPMDYDKYFGYAGLNLAADDADRVDDEAKWRIALCESPTELQQQIRADWLGEGDAK